MAKSSIHFSVVKATSEIHNNREQDLDYVFKDLSHENESWQSATVSEVKENAKRICKEISGRKLQKNAEPVREAVVNLNANHTMDDLKRLSRHLEQSHGLSCFQIHLHRDEGVSRLERNYHAHMLFDWQDKAKGTMKRNGKADLSRIQDTVSEVLGMERGERRENSNRDRLEAVEYKVHMESKKLSALQEQTQTLQAKTESLEQKKNQLISRNRKAGETAGTNARIDYLRTLAQGGTKCIRGNVKDQVPTIIEAIGYQSKINDELRAKSGEYERALSILFKRESQRQIDAEIERVEKAIKHHQRNIEKG